MKERENILRILKETREAINIDDATKIKTLSDQTINTAAFTQDPDNVAVAVIIYSLGKIFERESYRRMPGWTKFNSMIVKILDESIKDVEKKDDEKFRTDFTFIRKTINRISGKLQHYIQDVFRKADINKASRLYEHGISMEQTAKVLGITMFDLANYAGQTGISDVPESKTMTAKSRIKMAMEFFE